MSNKKLPDLKEKTSTDDLLLMGTTRKWPKPVNCSVVGEEVTISGGMTEYSPFDEYPQILEDFLTLVAKIEDLEAEAGALLDMKRQSQKAKANVHRSEICLLRDYREFVLKYGFLGVGLSRIVETSHQTDDSKGIITEWGSVKRLLIKGVPGINLRSFIDDSLPTIGGEITIEHWNMAYGGITRSSYKESLTQLMDCDIIWKIIEDLQAEREGKANDFRFEPGRVCICSRGGKPEFSWEFTSLIQALSIMYGSNKAQKYGYRVLRCPTCNRFFSTNDPLRKYCNSGSCKAAMMKRRYRKRKTVDSVDAATIARKDGAGHGQH